jgi:hypothetical protein
MSTLTIYIQQVKQHTLIFAGYTMWLTTSGIHIDVITALQGGDGNTKRDFNPKNNGISLSCVRWILSEMNAPNLSLTCYIF